jgi:hypothetical protein
MPIITRIPQLDDALGGGLPDTGLVLVGALVDGGQQELATHLAMTCAKESGRSTYHWLWREGGYDDGSNEPEARARMIVAHTGLPLRKVRTYQLEADQLDALKAAVLELQALPLELRTDVWSHDELRPEHIEAAIEPGSIHIIERIEDLFSEPTTTEQRQEVVECLARVAREKQALIIAVANCVWPDEHDCGPEPQPVAIWSELHAEADVTLLAGPLHPERWEGMKMRILVGQQVVEVWCPVENRSGRVGER